ncbi:7277_t:CDS:2, partial [Ambispora leptoticha]
FTDIWHVSSPIGRISASDRPIGRILIGLSEADILLIVFQLSYEQGGLTAPILKDMLDARLLSIWLKILTSNSFWATTERALATLKLYSKRNLDSRKALIQTSYKTKG